MVPGNPASKPSQAELPEQRARAPRADARRNVAAILAAGEACLSRDAEATMSQIAAEAGVGRVTLYGHFPSRGELVDAVFAKVVSDAHEVLGAVDITGDAAAALRRLIASSWRVVHRFSALLAAAERELPPDAVRGHHDAALQRLRQVLERGCSDGAFRRDVPHEWLATVCMTLMHTAAGEVDAGRLDAHDAEHTVVETILGACTTPGAGRGSRETGA